MMSKLFDWLKRYPVLAGFTLMFVCTWPIDLWAAANSHGLLLSLPIPSILPLLIGYGFVVASLIMTGSLAAGRVSAPYCANSWSGGLVYRGTGSSCLGRRSSISAQLPSMS